MQNATVSVDEIPFPYDIRFVDSDSSPATVVLIEDQLRKISRLSNRITDCRVAVSIPHKRSGSRSFHIHIQLDIPGKRLAVSRDPEVTDDHMDIRRSLNDAFHKLNRELVDYLKSR